MEKGIIIQGARQNNLKNIDLVLPRNKMIVLQDFQDQASHPSPLIPSMQKASAAMSNHCRPMRVSFWGRWINLKWIKLKDFHRPFQ